MPTKSRFFGGKRLAFWGGIVVLTLGEAFASTVRARFLPGVAFFKFPPLWLAMALLKGLVFGPTLGLLTLHAFRFWQQRDWESACFVCLRGGFWLGATQICFALAAFLGRSRFPFFSWLSLSWLHFALWLTLNIALLWALLLLVAGFLLPSNARKTVQIGEEMRL